MQVKEVLREISKYFEIKIKTQLIKICEISIKKCFKRIFIALNAHVGKNLLIYNQQFNFIVINLCHFSRTKLYRQYKDRGWQGLGEKEDQQAECRVFLGQWNYSV